MQGQSELALLKKSGFSRLVSGNLICHFRYLSPPISLFCVISDTHAWKSTSHFLMYGHSNWHSGWSKESHSMFSVTVLLRYIHLSSVWNSTNACKGLCLFPSSPGNLSKTIHNQNKLVCFNNCAFLTILAENSSVRWEPFDLFLT